LPFIYAFGVSRVSFCIYLVFRFFWCYLALFTGWSGNFACDYLETLFLGFCLYAYLVAKPAHNYEAGKSFDFKRATVFVFDTASQSIKWQETLEIYEEWSPWPSCLRLCSYQCFFLGRRVMLVFEITTFFRPSTYFLWSNGIDNQHHFVSNSLWLVPWHWLTGIFVNKFRHFG